MEKKLTLLKSYFEHNGLLLCNESRDLPSLDTVGGDWETVVSLMESGDVFYSKLYKGRVTYLSRELYYLIKPMKQRIEKLSPQSAELFGILSSAGPLTTTEIKGMLFLPSKAFNSCMDELHKELFITVITRDRDIQQNWSSFCWGNYALWEQKQISAPPQNRYAIYQILSALMPVKQIDSLLK